VPTQSISHATDRLLHRAATIFPALTNFMSSITATIWFHDEASYLRFREICVDGNRLPASYAAWLSITNEKVASLLRKNGTIRKIKADPDDFLLWCKSNAVAPNKVGRARYANARALSPAHFVN